MRRSREAVRAHAAENGIAERDVWATVDTYVREIVPFFNVVAYYQIGYRVSGWLLNLFYKVSVDFAEPKARERLPKDAVIVYVMNHRSNADYVLVSYALAGQVAISYAVGEWARAFPARARVQGVRLVLHSTPLSRAAVSQRCSSATSSSSRARG